MAWKNQVRVDLVRDHDEMMLESDLRQLLELGPGKDASGWIVRIGEQE